MLLNGGGSRQRTTAGADWARKLPHNNELPSENHLPDSAAELIASFSRNIKFIEIINRAKLV